MKKIILFLLLIFTTIPGFTYSYREILFGNNYENIIWIYLYKVIDSFNEKSTAVTLKDKNLEPQIINWIDYGFYVKELYKGKKCNDTCIAELDFQSEDGSWILEK